MSKPRFITGEVTVECGNPDCKSREEFVIEPDDLRASLLMPCGGCGEEICIDVDVTTQ